MHLTGGPPGAAQLHIIHLMRELHDQVSQVLDLVVLVIHLRDSSHVLGLGRGVHVLFHQSRKW